MSRDTEFNTDLFANLDNDITVYGYAGTCAETVAKIKRFRFVPYDEEATTAPATEPPTTAAPTEPTLPQIPVRPDYIYDADTLTCTLTDKEGASKPIMDDYAYGEAYQATTLIFDFDEEYRITNWCTQWFPSIEKIIVKGNISEIGRDAFSALIGQNLKEIVLSDKVTAITDGAFYGCQKITAIPEGVNLKVIGNSAFANCTGLTEINIPNTVTEIGKYAFGGNENITEVEIPETVESIGEYAFGYLYNSKQNSNYPIPNFRIIAQKDSAGAKYALENGFTLICDGEVITAPEPEETTTASVEPTTAVITTEPTETTAPVTTEPIATDPVEATTETTASVVTEPETATSPTTVPETDTSEPTTVFETVVPETTASETTTAAVSETDITLPTESVPILTEPTESDKIITVSAKKKTNPVKITVRKKTIKSKALRKSKKAVKTIKLINVTGVVKITKVKKGTTTKIYKKIKVDKKTGAIIFKKGKYPKKLYRVKLKIFVKGNSKYKAKTIIRTIKIRII